MTDDEPDFEADLENEIARQEQLQQKKWDFGWINRPFTLWFMTFIVLGIVGFLYKNYDSCTASMNADSDILRKISIEIKYRSDLLRSIFSLADARTRTNTEAVLPAVNEAR
jgi:hypothetical protein